MTRRELLGCAAAALPLPLAAKGRIDKSRVSVITDEIARTPEDAIAFARQYGLRWVELRGVPGNKKSYSYLSEAELRAAARQFADNGLKVSFLNTSLLKYGLPGTKVIRRRPETPAATEKRLAADAAEFERRMENLNRCIRAAEILGVNKVRIFAFLRVEEPMKLMPRIADVIGAMSKVAEKEGVQLLLENEASCNVATSAEAAALLKMVPSKALGVNWDPHNGVRFNEKPFPDGYRLLPLQRLGNVQIKGKTLLYAEEKLDWAAIFRALENDGYKGQVGLETHIFGDGQIQASHDSMREILRIVEPS